MRRTLKTVVIKFHFHKDISRLRNTVFHVLFLWYKFYRLAYVFSLIVHSFIRVAVDPEPQNNWVLMGHIHTSSDTRIGNLTLNNNKKKRKCIYIASYSFYIAFIQFKVLYKEKKKANNGSRVTILSSGDNVISRMRKRVGSTFLPSCYTALRRSMSSSLKGCGRLATCVLEEAGVSLQSPCLVAVACMPL